MGGALAPDATVELLGHTMPLRWEPTDRGLRVELPGRPAASPGFALRLTGITPTA